MQVFINDKAFECEESATLRETLENNGINTEHVAVAVDYTVIPRAEWDKTYLKDGSKIIIIKAVQGG